MNTGKVIEQQQSYRVLPSLESSRIKNPLHELVNFKSHRRLKSLKADTNELVTIEK